jgi:tetraether lipid synthase
MCVIPYATQEGEISFCAYNTGVGWRNIIEKMHMTATLTKWYEEHGRHAIYAGGKEVPLADMQHSLKLNPEHVARGPQVSEGPQTTRDEKLSKRDAEMMKLYREHVLKEKHVDLVQIGSSKPAAAPASLVTIGKKAEEPESELVAGD